MPEKVGKGIINNVITRLPVPLHLPGGYNYADPETHLELNLEKGFKPKSKLEKAAMHHNIAYSKSKCARQTPS